MIDSPRIDIDFAKIASIHKRTLHDTGFLGECSEKFIARFYASVASFGSTILFVARDELRSVEGFAFATTEKSKYYSLFFRERWFSTLFYPSVYIPVVRGFFRRSVQSPIVSYESELVQIAVDEASRGQGMGKQLLDAVQDDFRRRNISDLYLQVFADNTAAIALYEKYGFVTVADSVRAGRRKLIMKTIVRI